MARNVTQRRRVRAIWPIVALVVVLWQAGQAVTLGVVGVPGVWSMALQSPEEEPAFLIPPHGELSQWVRARAHEFAGGVDEDGRILYAFDVWLEPPAEMRDRLASVAYAFKAPSARPERQSSDDGAQGFQVRFAAAACARTILVILSFEDGRVREFEVDGCAVLV